MFTNKLSLLIINYDFFSKKVQVNNFIDERQ